MAKQIKRVGCGYRNINYQHHIPQQYCGHRHRAVGQHGYCGSVTVVRP
jgi:hypothetical protein